MSATRKKDLAIFKNDPEAQERARQKIVETAKLIRERRRKGKLTPEDWQERITI